MFYKNILSILKSLPTIYTFNGILIYLIKLILDYMSKNLLHLKDQLFHRKDIISNIVDKYLIFSIDIADIIDLSDHQQSNFIYDIGIQCFLQLLEDQYKLYAKFINKNNDMEYNFDKYGCNIRKNMPIWQQKLQGQINTQIRCKSFKRNSLQHIYINLVINHHKNIKEHPIKLIQRGQNACKYILQEIIKNIMIDKEKIYVEYLNNKIFPSFQRNGMHLSNNNSQNFENIEKQIIESNEIIKNYSINSMTYKIKDIKLLKLIQAPYILQEYLLKKPNPFSFVVQRIKIKEKIQVIRTVFDYPQVVVDEKFYTKTDLVVIRIPTIQQIYKVFGFHQEQTQKAQTIQRYFKKKMKKAIDTIIQSKDYRSKKPNIYLLPKDDTTSSQYDPQATKFLMDYCGLTMGQQQNTLNETNFVKRLEEIYSLSLTILDLQSCEKIHSDIKPQNIIFMNKQTSANYRVLITLVIDLQSMRKLQKNKVDFQDIQISTLQTKNNQKKIINLWKIFYRYIAKQNSNEREHQTSSVDQVQNKILNKIKQLIFQTTQVCLPKCLQQLKQQISIFQEKYSQKKDYRFIVTSEQINTLLGWRYDFESFMKIMQLSIFNMYSHIYENKFSRKAKLAYEFTEKVEQYVFKHISNSDKQMIDKVAMALNAICKIVQEN